MDDLIKPVKCPVCGHSFSTCFEKLNLLKSGAWQFFVDGLVMVIQSGQNETCSNCGVVLWVPIRGDPNLPFILIGGAFRYEERSQK